jgi:hypothetical protein
VIYRMRGGYLSVGLHAGVVLGVLLSLTPNSWAPLTKFNLWQLQYFGCTNCPQAAPDADPDGDGQNNLAEFAAGTDPTNSASVIRILSVVPATGGESAAKGVSSMVPEPAQLSVGLMVTYYGSGGSSTNGGPLNNNTPPPKTNVLEYSTSTPANGDFVSTGVTNIILEPGDVVTNMVDVCGATNGPVLFYRVQVLQ